MEPFFPKKGEYCAAGVVTNDEFEPIERRLPRHGVGELKKRLTWIRNRLTARQGLRPPQVERHTGQSPFRPDGRTL